MHINMNGIRTNIATCNFWLCSYSINYYSYRKFCDVQILLLAISLTFDIAQFVLGNSNYLTSFNNLAKSTNISSFSFYDYLFIIHVMITYK